MLEELRKLIYEVNLEFYRVFPFIGGVTHTHSINAVVLAQACLDIPVLGITHVDISMD